MPILKLRKHQAAFSDEDILINQSDIDGLKLRDLVELRCPKGGEPSNRVLLQVRKWPDTYSHPNCVSIKESVASVHLKLYSDVLVNIVDKKDVLVDSIEICFSNAYLARSYMWGLRNHLNEQCVYERQKLDHLHIRSQICEIWAQGARVSSGYVDDDTKIVFRSASSLVYLFIQMSSEMWDYDINGDLYCEKAINGFLTDLFETWRKNDCSHDITIVLFSRTFYEAESLSEFPEEMRECLQVDYKNRFYEDCYRVAFQNDRFDLHDWNAKLTTLKSLFNQYQKEVIDRHLDKYDTKIPRAYNSSAAQGNFLEVLNMSLNVFEKHYFNRSFDRTGQLSVVVSPGVGVFEVDFEMTNLTKQRIIDNGIGSDLVCLGEQPLHTVPLLKFNSKSLTWNDNLATCDVYNMPHWINLSFYSSQNQVFYSNFIPRIKLPTIHNKAGGAGGGKSLRNQMGELVHKDGASSCGRNSTENGSTAGSTDENNRDHRSSIQNRHHGSQYSTPSSMPDLIDYDEYDAQVFKPNSMINYNLQQPSSRGERSILSDLNSNIGYLTDENDDDPSDGDSRGRSVGGVQRRASEVNNYQDYGQNMKRQHISDNLPINSTTQVQASLTRMSLIDSYMADVKIKPETADDLSVRGYNVQSSRTNRTSARPKALINPFDPSHMTIKLTPNRRRWTHVFPLGPTGTFIQQHHYQQVPQKSGPAPYLANISIASGEGQVEDSVKGREVQTSPIGASIQPPVVTQPQNTAAATTTAATTIATNNTKPRLHVSTNKTGIASRKRTDTLSSIRSSTLYEPVIPASDLNVQPGHNKSALVSNDTIRFAWCASGEQEWTPAITTGVDWKSLTMPACLPLTTDFFPSKTSLQNDYVIGEYTIDSSCIHSRYTLIEVYRELVCQRLQKGFQIILLPKPPTAAAKSCSIYKSVPVSQPTTSSSKQVKVSWQHRQQHRMPQQPNILHAAQDNELDRECTEYTMSIGRIFHKLSLNGNTITVTQYRPRHPYPTIKIDYCYRFRAPFHQTYGQSWVHFKSEKLENYSWNYLDNYVCARGESFELRSSLKFWRFRLLVLPSRTSLRRLYGAEESRQDAYYSEFSDDERLALMESFTRLIDIINKTRNRLSNVSLNSSVPGGSPQAHHTATKQQQEVAKKKQPAPTRLSVKVVNARESATCASTATPPAAIEAASMVDSGNDRCKDQCKLRFVNINMDIDSALRDAMRSEWVHVQYHCCYDLNRAFELVIKWMVASGAGIAEMVQGWSRKAGNSSVHLVPIPWEPFALPHSGKADPLRCPIGIQLKLDCLPGGAELSDAQIVQFQEKILRRFGFLVFNDLISSDNIERQFVHLSGFAFVALPNLISDVEAGKQASGSQQGSPATTDNASMDLFAATSKPSKLSSTKSGLPIKGSKSAVVAAAAAAAVPSLILEHQETVSSPHEEYITRHIDGARQNKPANRLRGKNEQMEFIWSWNYMLTKRWRSVSTQDESSAVALMQDFTEFCHNGSNRLVEFWEAEMRGCL